MSNPGTNRENPAASRLGQLLRQVRVPAKTDNEWQRFENDLFVRLDEKPAPSAVPVFRSACRVSALHGP